MGCRYGQAKDPYRLALFNIELVFLRTNEHAFDKRFVLFLALESTSSATICQYPSEPELPSLVMGGSVPFEYFKFIVNKDYMK